MKNYLLLLLPAFLFSQNINPKGKWYFGVELGKNKVTSFQYNEGNESISFGALSEYYFAKHWSVQGRIKYMKTGVSYIKNPSSGWNFNWVKTNQILDDNSFSIYNRFDGQVLVVPIDIKKEIRIYQNLRGSLKMGVAFNYEMKSVYNYGNVDYSNFSKSYGNLNLGYGINYYLSEKYSLGIDVDYFFFGGSKGSTTGGIPWDRTYYATNTTSSIQLKYHFPN